MVCPPVLVYCGCSPYLSGLIILYPYIYGLSMLLVKYIHINMDKNKRPKLYTLPDTLQEVQHPPPSRSPGVACPAFWRVCRALRGPPCCLCCAVVPGALEWAGVHRWGIQGTPGVGQVSPVSSDQNKKGVFSVSLSLSPTPLSQIRTHPIVQVSKNSKK